MQVKKEHLHIEGLEHKMGLYKSEQGGVEQVLRHSTTFIDRMQNASTDFFGHLETKATQEKRDARRVVRVQRPCSPCPPTETSTHVPSPAPSVTSPSPPATHPQQLPAVCHCCRTSSPAPSVRPGWLAWVFLGFFSSLYFQRAYLVTLSDPATTAQGLVTVIPDFSTGTVTTVSDIVGVPIVTDSTAANDIVPIMITNSTAADDISTIFTTDTSLNLFLPPAVNFHGETGVAARQVNNKVYGAVACLTHQASTVIQPYSETFYSSVSSGPNVVHEQWASFRHQIAELARIARKHGDPIVIHFFSLFF
jgi:hypothetical protein